MYHYETLILKYNEVPHDGDRRLHHEPLTFDNLKWVLDSLFNSSKSDNTRELFSLNFVREGAVIIFRSAK